MGKTENTNTEGVTIVHVSSDTNVQKLAGSLLTAIENSTAVEVRAIGAGAVNQMYKAIASARGYVARKGRDLYIRPGFDEVIEEGSEKDKDRHGRKTDCDVRPKGEVIVSKILGYFTEDEIYYHGKKQPPRKTKIIAIGCNPMFSIDDYAEDEDIQVLSEDENWYTIKKKDIILGEC